MIPWRYLHAYACLAVESYAKAGSVTEEAFMAIRAVVSLGMEDHMARKYRENLKEAEQAALRASLWVAFGEQSP